MICDDPVPGKPSPRAPAWAARDTLKDWYYKAYDVLVYRRMRTDFAGPQEASA